MTNENGLEEENLNAAQVDAQRARHLLDRALGLSERGDLAGAIVVCRQALALAPHQPQGWSMLGLLYERNGEIDGAIEAYGKVLELSPSSTLERESLQRLRQHKGPTPRPAPSFHFDNGTDPAVPLTPQAANPIHQQSTSPIRWNSFYFRSLPFALAALCCLIILIAAQRSAFHRQHADRVNPPLAQSQQIATPAPSATSGTPAAGATTPPTAADLPPTALAPHVSHTMPDTPTNQPPAPSSTANPVSPVPRPAPPKRSSKPTAKPKPKPKPAAKPQTQPKAHSSTPSEMPVLPRPKITLPQRSAPAQPSENNSNHSTANPAPNNSGGSSSGPVDVGNSDDSKYIPINPPSFPNASRD